jgi:hypothetical protein
MKLINKRNILHRRADEARHSFLKTLPYAWLMEMTEEVLTLSFLSITKGEHYDNMHREVDSGRAL